MRYELSQRFTFEAAHSLPGRGVHGHSYSAEVSIAGAPDVGSGMVFDLDLLRQQVKNVRERLDHRLLDDVLTSPTLEHLCAFIWGGMSIPGYMRVSRVRVWRESVGDACTLTEA